MFQILERVKVFIIGLLKKTHRREIRSRHVHSFKLNILFAFSQFRLHFPLTRFSSVLYLPLFLSDSLSYTRTHIQTILCYLIITSLYFILLYVILYCSLLILWTFPLTIGFSFLNLKIRSIRLFDIFPKYLL